MYETVRTVRPTGTAPHSLPRALHPKTPYTMMCLSSGSWPARVAGGASGLRPPLLRES